MKFRVRIGEEFEVNSAEVADEKGRNTVLQHFITEFRAQIAMIVFGIAFLFLLGSAIVGLLQGNFSALESVWKVAAVPIGMVLAHYFQTKP